MGRIHKKSALTRSAPLILAAHEEGVNLLWERYEEQLPLCAFTANGLNCRKCFQGPCRINPFGDQPTRGVCGADRDQIVMETLFQATREGVLESARTISSPDESLSGQEIPGPDSDLPRQTQKRLTDHGVLPVRKGQILEVQNSYFSHKGYLAATLRDLTRMGLIHYAFLKGFAQSVSSSAPAESGDDSGKANILIVGRPPAGHISAFRRKVQEGNEGEKIALWLQGMTDIPAFPSIPDHGSPEMALAMNLDALILYPDAHLPSLEDLAKKWEIPVLLGQEEKGIEWIAAQAFELARGHQKKKVRFVSSGIPPGPSGRAPILDRVKDVQEAMSAGKIGGILVLWAEPNVKQAFFERTLTLMENALKEKFLVFAGGEAAAQAHLLEEELERRMGGKKPDLPGSRIRLLNYLGSRGEIPALVAFLRSLNPDKEFNEMPLVVSFPEFYRTSTWAVAVTFLSMGFAVQLGAQLPFWGSPSLSQVLLKEWPRISGGVLLASPSLPDGPAQAQEIKSYIQSQSFSP
jgi:hypothetical protein